MSSRTATVEHIVNEIDAMCIFVHVNICEFKVLTLFVIVFYTIVSFFVSAFIYTDSSCIAADPAFAFSDVAHTTAITAVFADPCIAIPVIIRRGRRQL